MEMEMEMEMEGKEEYARIDLGRTVTCSGHCAKDR